MDGADGNAEQAALDLAMAYADLSQVSAVALGGSRATGRADQDSDIDLYVYATADVPIPVRAALVARRGARAEIDNRFWETGDEWDDAQAGVHVDVMLRGTDWAEQELASVLDRHEARLGYTTCFWHNILTSRPLFDRSGWFATLQDKARRPYPDALARAIVARNHPVLGTIASSFRAQILKAAARGDMVSVNHRTAAFIASYFDLLFALDRTPHPGEKRLVAIARTLPGTPPALERNLDRLLAAAGTLEPGDLAAALDALCSDMDRRVSSAFPDRGR